MLGSGDATREPYQEYRQWFDSEDAGRLNRKSEQAEGFFRRTGITFNVYGREEAEERLIPFDIIRAFCPPANGASFRAVSSSGCAL